MKLLLHLCVVCGFSNARPKNRFGLGAQFLFPVRDLIGLDVKLLG
jgi:hypothetical protein